MRKIWAGLALVVAFGLTGIACGSDDDGAADAGSTTTGSPYATTPRADTPFSASDVEKAVAADAQGGGVVDLDGDSPKSVSCEKDDTPIRWRCSIGLSEGGRTMLCVVTVDETTRTITERSCAPVDN